MTRKLLGWAYHLALAWFTIEIVWLRLNDRLPTQFTAFVPWVVVAANLWLLTRFVARTRAEKS